MASPQTFELDIDANGIAGPGLGVLAAYVPASDDGLTVVLVACDPRHDPGRPISELAPAVLAYLSPKLPVGDTPCWTAIDGYGRFTEAVPTGSPVPGAVPSLEFRRFPFGLGIDAFFKATGASGEAAIELLSAVLEAPTMSTETPTMREFLDTVEGHGNLPAPGAIFHKVEAAAGAGDAKSIAAVIQPDPVISLSLINSANAARFAGTGKTASVPQAVIRLGTSFVRRVVFVAEMMARYQKGICPGFDYRGYWLNAIASGAAMRALMPKYELPGSMADEAFTTGLVSGIGWLAIAETFPGLMVKYLERCRGADPISKALAQQEIFPCEIRRVSERYLERYDFPPTVQLAVAGKTDSGRGWYDCLAQATRVAQALSPFECVAVPTTIPVPDACREEWVRWQDFVAAIH